MKDEYAADFGLDGATDLEGFRNASLDSDEERTFLILGTSADDKSAHPHVLSPPLMQSLTNFVPENISEQNLWLKYSLIRDGASSITLQEYTKKSKYTILAIETTNGEVFGAFLGTP